MDSDNFESNLETFCNDAYLKYLGKKWEISSDAFQYLHPFQMLGIQFLFENLKRNQSCILDYDPGMGKTVIICLLLDTIMRTKNQIHAMVICEHNLIDHWYEHFIKWTHFDPVCFKKSSDAENFQLADKSILIVNFEILNEIKISQSNLIIIDNADQKSIINNRHLKKFKEFLKSSMFILLTNAAIRKPSKRETLWYILHFLKAEPLVPSLKKFTSESLLTLQDKIWFPWRYLYQRMSWSIYPTYKDMMQDKSIEILKRSVTKLPQTFEKDTPINATSKDNESIIDLNNIQIEIKTDKSELTLYNNSKINKKNENYFIEMNNEYLTPSCVKVRHIIETQKIKSSPIHNKIENEDAICSPNDNKLVKIDNTPINGGTLQNRFDTKDNNSKERKWDNFFERLISTKKINNAAQCSNEVVVDKRNNEIIEVINEENRLSEKNEVMVCSKGKFQVDVEQSIEDYAIIVEQKINDKPIEKGNTLNALFDKLIPDDKIIDFRERSTFLVNNCETIDEALEGKVSNKLVKNQNNSDIIDKLNSNEGNERKKFKSQVIDDATEQTKAAKELETKVDTKNLNAKKSNNFETFFDKLISRK